MPAVRATRNFTLSSTSGFALSMKKGEVRSVPPYVLQELYAHGCMPVGDAEIPQATPEVDRPTAIRKVVFDLYKSGDTTAFTNSGRPRKAAVENAVGFVISSTELDEATKAVQSALNGDG